MLKLTYSIIAIKICFLLKTSVRGFFVRVACLSTICRKSIDMDAKQLWDDLEGRNGLEAC